MNSTQNTSDALVVAGRSFKSRLFLGTGKFHSTQKMQAAIESSGTEMVTVALRRVDFENGSDEDSMRENLLEVIDTSSIQLLPNTSGAANAEEAVRLAKLAQAMGCGNWVKLEIHPNPRHLMPDPIETLKAAEELVKAGFIVLPYITADPVLAKRLEETGCATVMPLGAPIGSNKGLKTKDSIAIIIEESNIPVVVDAGIGWPSQAAEAMEMGADAVLVNTAIAIAQDPVAIAAAFKAATEAGRTAFLFGHGQHGNTSSTSGAEPTSPLTSFLDS